MKEEIITFEVAKLAKEKGYYVKIIGTFNGNHYYNYKGELDGDQLEVIKSISDSKPNPLIANIAAPTQSVLQRWLRERYQIDIIILPKLKDLGKFYGGYIDNDTEMIHKSIGSNFLTYEKALEEGLLKALEQIK